MKKLLILMSAALLAFGITSCNKDDGNGDGDQTSGQIKGTTWSKLAEEYPFLNDFPSYDATIDNYHHSITFGVESLGFFDYNCSAEQFTVYSGKLESAGFESNPNAQTSSSAMYSKSVTGAELNVSLGYSAGSLAVSISKIPK